MKGLPTKLLSELMDILLVCGPFASDSELQPLFIDERIAFLKGSIPQANSPRARISILLEYLYSKENQDRQRALVLFLDVLLERIHPEDGCSQKLKEVRVKLLNWLQQDKTDSNEPEQNLLAKGKIGDVNPFYVGGAVPPNLFVGRTRTLDFLQDRLRQSLSVSIVGERRIGKSSLLLYVQSQANNLFFPLKPIVVYLDLMRGYCETRSGLMKKLRLELTAALGHLLWPDQEDGNLEALAFALERIGDSGVHLILCLDEIEQLAKRPEEFDALLEELRGAGQLGLVSILTASVRSLAEICQQAGLTSPFFNIFAQETIGLFTQSEWLSLVRTHMDVSGYEIKMLEDLAGGHPFFTQLAAMRLWAAHAEGTLDSWSETVLAELERHWLHQWRHFAPDEKMALQFCGGINRQPPSSRVLRTLHERGLLKDNKGFSKAYQSWMMKMKRAE